MPDTAFELGSIVFYRNEPLKAIFRIAEDKVVRMGESDKHKDFEKPLGGFNGDAIGEVTQVIEQVFGFVYMVRQEETGRQAALHAKVGRMLAG